MVAFGQMLDQLERLRTASEERRETLRRFQSRGKNQRPIIFNPAAHARKALAEECDVRMPEAEKLRREEEGQSSNSSSPDSIMIVPTQRREISPWWGSETRHVQRMTQQELFSDQVAAALKQVNLHGTPPTAVRAAQEATSPSPPRAQSPVPSLPPSDHVGRQRVDHDWTLEAMMEMAERCQESLRRRDDRHLHVLDCLDIIERALERGDEDELMDEKFSGTIPDRGITRERRRRLPTMHEGRSSCEVW